jgi:hypothetical protein
MIEGVMGMDTHELFKPTVTEMNEAIVIPERVTPEGLRARADIVRKALGDESCARHLELAADEIARLKARRVGDDPNLEANAYGMATEKATREAKFTLLRERRVLGYLVIPCEKVYDIGTHLLHLYDKLEGIE